MAPTKLQFTKISWCQILSPEHIWVKGRNRPSSCDVTPAVTSLRQAHTQGNGGVTSQKQTQASSHFQSSAQTMFSPTFVVQNAKLETAMHLIWGNTWSNTKHSSKNAPDLIARKPNSQSRQLNLAHLSPVYKSVNQWMMTMMKNLRQVIN